MSFDVDEAASAARRERSLPPPPAAEELPEADDERSEPADTRGSAGLEAASHDGAGRRRRRRKRGREGQVEAEPAADTTDDAPALEAYPDTLPEEPPPELENMITLYFNVGKRDGLEAKDLASLLTSACELGMEDIGRVRVKDRHAFVGVPSERADAVITCLEGQTVRSRSLHVERART